MRTDRAKPTATEQPDWVFVVHTYITSRFYVFNSNFIDQIWNYSNGSQRDHDCLTYTNWALNYVLIKSLIRAAWQGQSMTLPLFWRIRQSRYNSRLVWMTIYAAELSFSKPLESRWGDMCCSRYQTNMFSYISGTSTVGRSISAALRRFIIMLLCHTFLLLSENCSFSDVVVGHIVVLAMFLINFAAHADIREKRHDAVYCIFTKKRDPLPGLVWAG